jgi:hypothetical protein
VFVTDEDWAATLRGTRAALRPGGRLVFESRDPAKQAWLGWTREQTRTATVLPGVGLVEKWHEVTGVSGQLVSFRTVFEFEADGAVIISESTLRFRERNDLESSLSAAGYRFDEVRDAPDRPGLELVFIASRPA